MKTKKRNTAFIWMNFLWEERWCAADQYVDLYFAVNEDELALPLPFLSFRITLRLGKMYFVLLSVWNIAYINNSVENFEFHKDKYHSSLCFS